jgi:hypothetical protein
MVRMRVHQTEVIEWYYLSMPHAMTHSINASRFVGQAIIERRSVKLMRMGLIEYYRFRYQCRAGGRSDTRQWGTELGSMIQPGEED